MSPVDFCSEDNSSRPTLLRLEEEDFSVNQTPAPRKRKHVDRRSVSITEKTGLKTGQTGPAGPKRSKKRKLSRRDNTELQLDDSKFSEKFSEDLPSPFSSQLTVEGFPTASTDTGETSSQQNGNLVGRFISKLATGTQTIPSDLGSAPETFEIRKGKITGTRKSRKIKDIQSTLNGLVPQYTSALLPMGKCFSREEQTTPSHNHPSSPCPEETEEMRNNKRKSFLGKDSTPRDDFKRPSINGTTTQPDEGVKSKAGDLGHDSIDDLRPSQIPVHADNGNMESSSRIQDTPLPENARAPPERRRLSMIQSPPAKEEPSEAKRGHVDLKAPSPRTEERRGSLADKISHDARNVSLAGEQASIRQQNFESKPETSRGEVNNWLISRGIGHVCKKGLKPESPNQDDFFIYSFDSVRLYGVFDGHGPFGHFVSNYVQKTIPELIYADDRFSSDPLAAVAVSFSQVHQRLVKQSMENKLNCSLSGTTATVVVHQLELNKLHVAHVGDSRCVLGKRKSSKEGWEALDLTDDHKPNNEKERKRIIAAGGQVIRLEGDVPHRVFVKGKLYPGLAMSRAIGDTVGADVGVICDPDTRTVNLDRHTDHFMLICSDGVWEFITSQEAVEMVASFSREKVQDAAEALARESWARWIREEGDVVDDITVQVIYLFPETL